MPANSRFRVKRTEDCAGQVGASSPLDMMKIKGVTHNVDPSTSDARCMRIDYAFVDESMEKRVLGAWIDETAQGSDHQPYWFDLDYAPYD